MSLKKTSKPRLNKDATTLNESQGQSPLAEPLDEPLAEPPAEAEYHSFDDWEEALKWLND
ncbi:MAG: hypothetical protein LBS60_14380 [Deltaproteobacteria bacterium]|jgi:hypothetical protein|nr:hypothetical protein [Deltaproteobacteria bacterium]